MPLPTATSTLTPTSTSAPTPSATRTPEPTATPVTLNVTGLQEELRVPDTDLIGKPIKIEMQIPGSPDIHLGPALAIHPNAVVVSLRDERSIRWENPETSPAWVFSIVEHTIESLCGFSNQVQDFPDLLPNYDKAENAAARDLVKEKIREGCNVRLPSATNAIGVVDASGRAYYHEKSVPPVRFMLRPESMLVFVSASPDLVAENSTFNRQAVVLDFGTFSDASGTITVVGFRSMSVAVLIEESNNIIYLVVANKDLPMIEGMSPPESALLNSASVLRSWVKGERPDRIAWGDRAFQLSLLGIKDNQWTLKVPLLTQ